MGHVDSVCFYKPFAMLPNSMTQTQGCLTRHQNNKVFCSTLKTYKLIIIHAIMNTHM